MASGRQQVQVRYVDADARNRLRAVFENLEADLKIDGIGVVLTTAVLELVENAVKANLKRAFFSKNTYNFEDPTSYTAGIESFVKSYPDIRQGHYDSALKDLELVVSVQVDYNDHRLLVYVENNAVLVSQEEIRIRKQLAAAMLSDKIAEFYVQYGDETEGSGLGLAMIVVLIRNLGFDAHNFRVFQKDNRTIARLEFPLNADYVPIRERWRREHPAG
ncbi:MAG TPA: hypothetical protein PKX74_16875 [Leptospiraceae bacterium]|jgi:hypothetical protein|nr:hypothetical protein [Leptospirales bacterium]HMU84960.1 hypothetical protein [Leptospiraceae bacterium]HMY47154.1 hypothetical protein [Leptospiraceae bacterium]HNN60691.1 hypothetical protein [Leptospiraceae bacterium]